MADKITSSLAYLTDYLRQENVRIDKEEKEQDLNQAISKAAEQFKSLGPNATPEQARGLFFDTIRTATQENAEEAIPFIQGLYSDSLSYVAQQKALKEDASLKGAIKERFGTSYDGLTGSQTAEMLQLDLSTMLKQETKDEQGRSYLSTFKLGPKGYTPIGEKITLNPVTLEDEFQRELRMLKEKGKIEIQIAGVKAGIASGASSQKTTFFVEKNGSKIPVEFVPGRGYITRDPNTGQAKIVDFSKDKVTKLEGEGIVENRTLNQLKKRQEVAYEQLKVPVTSLARYIVQYGDPEEKSVFRNINDQKLQAEAFGSIMAMANTQTATGNALLDEIQKIEDPSAKESALVMYESITEQAAPYNELSSAILGANEEEKRITYTKNYNGVVNAINNNNEIVKKEIAKMWKKKPGDVTINDWEQLRDEHKIQVLNRIASYQKKK